MIVREGAQGQAVVLSQETHADLAAQFAAHWGNERFARLRPYDTMLFATIYHDSHHRELEATLPINPAKGRPYAFREGGEKPLAGEALHRNLAWLRDQDPYAGLIVSMHHSGLPQNRYDTVSMASKAVGGGSSAPRGLNPERKAFLEALEAGQQRDKERLQLTDRTGSGSAGAGAELWFNYRLLQVFDLLSLYFCCDGYEQEHLKSDCLRGVPVRYGSDEEVQLSLTPAPVEGEAIRVSPYPFDVSPLVVSVDGRLMRQAGGLPEEAARRAYYCAPRTSLTWQLLR